MTKKAILGVSILLVLLFCLPSCAPVVSQEEYDALQSRLDNAQGEIDALKTDLAALQDNYESSQADYEGLQANYDSLQDDYESLRADYDSLQADYEGSLERLKQSELENPTWSELRKFLERDDTDTLPYVEGSFDCSGFAITLRDRTWRYGMRCAYVEVGFSKKEGHALNAFETTDEGLIYVDNTQADQIAYIEIGQPYRAIHLDAVKSKYIACSGDPDEFWGSLTYTTHSHPFSYDYCVDYYRRVQFYEESMVAYNVAVKEFNNGSREWTLSQLESWRENLEALEEDIGSIFHEPKGRVETVEVYWD